MKREEIIKIINELEIDRNNVVVTTLKIRVEEILNKLEEEEYISDSRFTTNGRRDALEEDFNIKLENNNYLDAYYDIVDYIDGSTCFTKSNDLETLNQEYLKDGIICKEEYDILASMCKKFIDKLTNKDGLDVDKLIKEVDIQLEKLEND